MIEPLWKTVWRFFKKLGIKPPCDPEIPLLGIYPEENKIERDTRIPLFIAAVFTIARTWKQPRCPSSDERIKKFWYIYTMEYYSAIKRNRRRKWQPTPMFLPGESQGRGSLVGCRLWGHTELDTTEAT